MCSCGANKVVNVQQMISRVGSSLPYLKFAYCAYPTQMKSLFSKFGMNVNEQTLPIIANLANTGGDLRGDFKGVKFSVVETLNKINAQNRESNSCSV